MRKRCSVCRNCATCTLCNQTSYLNGYRTICRNITNIFYCNLAIYVLNVWFVLFFPIQLNCYISYSQVIQLCKVICKFQWIIFSILTSITTIIIVLQRVSDLTTSNGNAAADILRELSIAEAECILRRSCRCGLRIAAFRCSGCCVGDVTSLAFLYGNRNLDFLRFSNYYCERASRQVRLVNLQIRFIVKGIGQAAECDVLFTRIGNRNRILQRIPYRINGLINRFCNREAGGRLFDIDIFRCNRFILFRCAEINSVPDGLHGSADIVIYLADYIACKGFVDTKSFLCPSNSLSVNCTIRFMTANSNAGYWC